MRWHVAERALVVESPAKLNLFLEILDKRSDGFHELETLMLTVDWYDTLSFRLCDNEAPASTNDSPVRLRCTMADGRPTANASVPASFAISTKESAAAETVPTGQDNLVLRAAALLKSVTGAGLPTEIHLVKRIPMAAGLAGGSGNAAATLWALNRLWGTGLSLSELRSLSGQLGSDVAFFLSEGVAAICRGRGERIQPIDMPAGLHFVVARPATGLSTAEVYRHCRISPAPRSVQPLSEHLRQGRWDRAGQCLHNALQPPAESLNSDVRELKTSFSRLPVLGHQMSGSGTAWFGICANRRSAESAAGRLRARGVPYVAVVQCRP